MRVLNLLVLQWEQQTEGVGNNSRRWAMSACRGQRGLCLVNQLIQNGCRAWSGCFSLWKRHFRLLCQVWDFRNKQKYSLQQRADEEVEEGQGDAGGKADSCPSKLHELLSLLSRLGNSAMLAGLAALSWPPEVRGKKEKLCIYLSHMVGTTPRRRLRVIKPPQRFLCTLQTASGGLLWWSTWGTWWGNGTSDVCQGELGWPVVV